MHQNNNVCLSNKVVSGGISLKHENIVNMLYYFSYKAKDAGKFAHMMRRHEATGMLFQRRILVRP